MPSTDAANCPRCEYSLTGLDAQRCPECGGNVASGEALGTYRERTPGRRRQFTLFADRILVRQRTLFGTQFDVSIPIADLDPQTALLRIWPPALKPALTMLACGAGFVGFMVVADVLDTMTMQVWAAAALGLAGLIGAMLNRRRIEYVLFRARGRAEVTLLDVARAGPEVGRYDDFVHGIRRQVIAAQR